MVHSTRSWMFGLTTLALALSACTDAPYGTPLSPDASPSAIDGTPGQVDVTPDSSDVQVGGSLQLSALVYDAGGVPRPKARYQWSSSNPAVATVSSTGLVTAVASGKAIITATVRTVSGSAVINVPPPAGGPYTFCVPAGNVCLFLGLRDVRLVAANGAYVSQTAYHIVPCAVYGFGGRNPGPSPQHCEYGPMMTTTLANPNPGMGGLPAVVTVPMGAPGFGVARQQQSVPGVPAGSGSFRTQCSLAKFAFDDPIVYPGQPGASHLHMFFGNVGVNAFSTSQSLVTSGNSTCRGGTLNRTAYWIPALFDSRTGVVQVPDEATFYYKTGYGMDPKVIKPMPAGLRMLVGDKSSTSKQPYIDWFCLNGSAGGNGASIPLCRTGDNVRLQLIFPQCWDGKNLDSQDHKSHLAYPIYRNPPQVSTCPSTHPVALPELTEIFDWPVSAAQNPAFWRLTADMYSSTMPGGLSAHADWMYGWDSTTMGTFTTNCLDRSMDCGVGLLGNGWEIY